MATWTNIPDSVLEPGKPARSVDALALRDNPIAIAQGAAGAPKVLAAALNRSNNEAQWLISTLKLGTAVAGTEHLVKRANNNGLTMTGGFGSGPLEYAPHGIAYLRWDGSGTSNAVSAAVDGNFYASALVPGTYRIDVGTTNSSGGGSGTTRTRITRNGAVVATGPNRSNGSYSETFTVSFAAGDSVGIRVERNGAGNRETSILVTSVLIRTTNANKGFMV